MSCEKCDKCQICQKSTHRSEEEKKKITKRLNIIEGQVIEEVTNLIKRIR